MMMKKKYEKPEIVDLKIPEAWAGNFDNPSGHCTVGTNVGQSPPEQPGQCETGWHPCERGCCFSGTGADVCGDYCGTGSNLGG